MSRVFVTGARGFVGRWLDADLRAAGHDVLALEPNVDVRERSALEAAIQAAGPIDAIAHLAAVAYGPDAAADATTAYATAIQGTLNVVELARAIDPAPAVLVTGSGEVYGVPDPGALPLTELSTLNAVSPYSLSKLAQEAVALEYGARLDLRVIVTRSFNHTGPGQRLPFVVPSLARRIAALKAGHRDHVRVGNIDVRRDFSDVRDVVRAYRLLVEAALGDDLGRGGVVVNVCSGRSVTIRSVGEELARFAGVEPRFWVDPELVRGSNAPDVRGDSSLLQRTTSWKPEIGLEQTLRDVWNEAAADPDSWANA